MPYVHKFKAWDSVIFISVIGLILTFCAFKYGKATEKGTFVDYFKGQYTQSQRKNDELLQENAILKDKLMNSSKVQVPQATKSVVRFYLQKYFGDEAETAEKVFTCESGLSPTGVHVNKPGLGSDFGVAQINDRFHKARFEKMYDVAWDTGIYDVNLNIQYAKYLYDHSGFNPWVCAKIVKVI